MNNFNDIYGQENVKQVLTNLINSGKIPHALLFRGIDGCGKDFTAIKFAQILNVKFSDKTDTSKLTSSISKLSEPFIKFIFPLPRGKNETESHGPIEKLSDEDLENLKEELSNKIKNPYYKIKLPRANNIKISSIRDINKFISFNYSDVNYRIILVSDAHLMNEASQNALLKNLEEPPEGVVFIITTPFPDKLRETIRSRCWNINFQPLKTEEIKNVLVKNFQVEEKLSETVSPFAGGSITVALNLLEHDFEALLDKTIHILRYSFGRKYHLALEEFTSIISENNSNTVKLLINMMIVWLNDIQKHRFGKKDFYFKSYLETLNKFNIRYGNLEINNTVVQLDKLAALINNNVNLQVIINNIIFTLAKLTIKTNPTVTKK